MAKRKTYVRIESSTEGVRVAGHDTYLTPWSSYGGAVDAVLEEVEAGKPATLTFTVLEMTDEEFDAYCRDNDVDSGDR